MNPILSLLYIFTNSDISSRYKCHAYIMLDIFLASNLEIAIHPHAHISCDESHPIIYGFRYWYHTSDEACSHEERNGGRSSRFMGSIRVHHRGEERYCMACVLLYCPRLFIVANAIQFRGSSILWVWVRDTWNLPMIQIPLCPFH